MVEQMRKQAREMLLQLLSDVETCQLSRGICRLLIHGMSILENEDLIKYCSRCEKLCRISGCRKGPEQCNLAIKALEGGDEASFLKHCAESRKACTIALNRVKQKRKAQQTGELKETDKQQPLFYGV